MDSLPDCWRLDRLPSSAVVLEEPVCLLTENGPDFSVLFARRLSHDPARVATVLEEVRHFKLYHKGKPRALSRTYASVAVRWHASPRCWEASPDDFHTLFALPSRDPYVAIPMPEDLMPMVEGWLKLEWHWRIFDLLRRRFGRLPGFYSPNESRLIAPDHYANAALAYPTGQRWL